MSTVTAPAPTLDRLPWFRPAPGSLHARPGRTKIREGRLSKLPHLRAGRPRTTFPARGSIMRFFLIVLDKHESTGYIVRINATGCNRRRSL